MRDYRQAAVAVTSVQKSKAPHRDINQVHRIACLRTFK